MVEEVVGSRLIVIRTGYEFWMMSIPVAGNEVEFDRRGAALLFLFTLNILFCGLLYLPLFL